MGDFEELGYPKTAYEFSKVGLIAITKIQQKMFNNDPRADLIVSSVCPGFCSTEMTESKGFFTAEQGFIKKEISFFFFKEIFHKFHF